MQTFNTNLDHFTNDRPRHALSQETLKPAAKRIQLSTRVTAQSSQLHPIALQCSRRLAALRAEESRREQCLLLDPFAAALAQETTAGGLAGGGAYDLIAARFVDEQVLHAASLANVGRQQEYNQVVLVGDGMCTRPFRLPWPTGTVIYLIAPGEVHERAEAILSERQVRVPRGCLLRRVDADLQGGAGFAAALEKAGYRGDRLAVWALQGIACLELSTAALGSLFADMTNAAALESWTLGELPPVHVREAENLLASYGLLGSIVGYAEVQFDEGSGACQRAVREVEAALDPEAPRPWLFRAQQRRLSLQEMGIYNEHVAAAEEADEDFFGNFS